MATAAPDKRKERIVTKDGELKSYDLKTKRFVFARWEDMTPDQQDWYRRRWPEFRPAGEAEPEPDAEDAPDEPEHIAELRAFIASYREEIAEVTAERRRTTDETLRARMRERIHALTGLVELHEYAIGVDPAPQKYGHDRSEAFTVVVPGRDPIRFNGHMFTARDHIHKAALERLIGQERHLRRIDSLERPFFDRETGDFRGWDTVSRKQAAGENLAAYHIY